MQFCLFRLRGPKSSHVLNKVLKIKEREIRDLLEAAAEFTNTDIPKNTLFSFETEIPIQEGKQPKVSRELLNPTSNLIPKTPPKFSFFLTENSFNEFW